MGFAHCETRLGFVVHCETRREKRNPTREATTSAQLGLCTLFCRVRI